MAGTSLTESPAHGNEGFNTACEYYYVTVRRQALKRLRHMVGHDDYFAGILPPYVPLWRFEEE